MGESYDAIVGDEAWEVHKFLHYNSSLKPAPFVFIIDFIGAMDVSQDKKERSHVKDLTGSWIEMLEIYPEGCNLSIFKGEAEDLPDVPFGVGFPNIREWGLKHFTFPGYVLPEDIDHYASKRQAKWSSFWRVHAGVAYLSKSISRIVFRKMKHSLPIYTFLPALACMLPSHYFRTCLP